MTRLTTGIRAWRRIAWAIVPPGTALAFAGLALLAGPAFALTEQDCVDFIRDQAALKYRVPVGNVDVKWDGPPLAQQLRSNLPKDARVTMGGALYRLYGTTPVPLQIWTMGTKVATIYPRFTIDVRQEVAVAAGRIGRGQPLDGNLVRLEKRHIKDVAVQAFTSVDGVLGSLATIDIPAGTVLAGNMVESPPIMKNGANVSVRLMSGGLLILSSGQVLQDGRRGQLVRVLNTKSRRDFLARVAGPDIVEVEIEPEEGQ